jgi:hypothetical protein
VKRRTVLVGSRKSCDEWLAEATVQARDCVLVTSAVGVLQLRGRDPRDLDIIVLPSAVRLNRWSDIRAELDYIAELLDRVNAKGRR